MILPRRQMSSVLSGFYGETRLFGCVITQALANMSNLCTYIMIETVVLVTLYATAKSLGIIPEANMPKSETE